MRINKDALASYALARLLENKSISHKERKALLESLAKDCEISGEKRNAYYLRTIRSRYKYVIDYKDIDEIIIKILTSSQFVNNLSDM